MLLIKFTSQAFIILITCACTWITADGQCTIDPNKIVINDVTDISLIDEYSPILFAYPEASSINVVIDKDEKLNVFCPGELNADGTNEEKSGVVDFKDAPITYQNELDCNGKNLEFIGAEINIADFKCAYPSKKKKYGSVIREVGECNNGKLYNIGFEKFDNFFTIVEICYNETNVNTNWAYSKIYSSVDVVTKKRIPYEGNKILRSGTSSTSNLENIYSFNALRDTFVKILGKTDVSTYLVKTKSNQRFLTKGLLVAYEDKLYQHERDSTVFFENTLPMWSQIRSGNWLVVEKFVRDLAKKQGNDLLVWTGGFGVLKLEGKEIYLSDGKKVPVPRLFYKVVVDWITDNAIVLIVVNNPYIAQTDFLSQNREYRICEKIGDCDRYFKKSSDKNLGLLYCCALNDFYTQHKETIGIDVLEYYTANKPFEI